MSAAPTASGTLQKTPMSHLLVYMLDREVNGTVVVEEPGGGKSAVWFQGGMPCKAKIASPTLFLGEILLEGGRLTRAAHERTLGQATTAKRLHGEQLVADGAIDARGLFDALREQLVRKVVWMFGLPAESAYGYYADTNFLERWGGPEDVPADPYAALWRGVTAHEHPARIAKTLMELGDRPIRTHVGAQLPRFKFDPATQAVVDVMRAKPQSLASLLATGLAPRTTVERLLYVLALTRCLDMGAAPSIPVGAIPSTVTPPSNDDPDSPQPPSSRRTAGDPEILARKREVVERASVIDKLSYYEILDVGRADLGADIQQKFYDLAKRWHPDRFGPEFADVRGAVTRVFARMNEAQQNLCDEQRRKDYDELLKHGGTGSADEQEEVKRVLSAVNEFRKAEVLLKKGNLGLAEEHAKRAFEADPEQAEYIAIYAWIRSQAPERVQSGKVLDLVSQIDRAVDKAPNNERIRFWRAQLYKRAGQTEEAMKDFKWIVSRNKNHLEAMRELRLLRMRGGRDSEPPRGGVAGGAGASPNKVGGFLKGLFKKD